MSFNQADLGETQLSLINHYKNFLRLERKRLLILHNNGGSGFLVCRRYAALLDIIIRQIFEQCLWDLDDSLFNLPFSNENYYKKWRAPFTLLATGGYGRALLNPGSDIDFLFLVRQEHESLPDEVKKLIESILYFLWDVGFQVGHATRTLNDAILKANKDTWIKSSLIDARLICGGYKIFTDFRDKFRSKCLLGVEEDYIASRREDFLKRLDRFSNTVFLQEPDVKQSPGGLRDIQNLSWICFVKYGTRQLRFLIKQRLLSIRSYEAIMHGYNFLLRVRNELHYQQDRASDKLTLHLQGQVAKAFKYPQKNLLKRIEAFMRDYYTHTKNVFLAVSSVMERLSIIDFSSNKEKGKANFSNLVFKRKKKQDFNNFFVKKGLLFYEKIDIFKKDPSAMMRLFWHLQHWNLELSPQLRRLIQKNLPQVNKKFRYSKKIREQFEAILSEKGNVANILRKMHRVDFLGAYLPEFGALTCLVQHEFFHIFTADEHTLSCVDKIDELFNLEDSSKEIYVKIFNELDEPYIFYLAIILHDCGRAALNEEKHTNASLLFAKRVCNRLKISDSRKDFLLFLVENHLLFWNIVTKKDIEDIKVISAFAKIVKKQIYLDALLLFTYADTNATNTDAWNMWKKSLLEKLYNLTSAYLQDKKSFYEKQDNKKRRNLVVNYLSKALKQKTEQKAREFIGQMPDNYLRVKNKSSLISHYKLFYQFKKQKKEISFLWRNILSLSCSELVICVKDYPLLLSKVSASLLINNLNILSADLHTRKDGIIILIIRTCNIKMLPITEKYLQTRINKQIEKNLKLSLQQIEKNIAKSPYKKNIKKTLINQFSKKFKVLKKQGEYILEVTTIDRLGLLYELIVIIEKLDFQPIFTKINTNAGIVNDLIRFVDKAQNQNLKQKKELLEQRLEKLKKQICQIL